MNELWRGVKNFRETLIYVAILSAPFVWSVFEQQPALVDDASTMVIGFLVVWALFNLLPTVFYAVAEFLYREAEQKEPPHSIYEIVMDLLGAGVLFASLAYVRHERTPNFLYEAWLYAGIARAGQLVYRARVIRRKHEKAEEAQEAK